MEIIVDDFWKYGYHTSGSGDHEEGYHINSNGPIPNEEPQFPRKIKANK